MSSIDDILISEDLLNEEHLQENITVLCGKIEYHKNSLMEEVRGVSLLHVRDLLKKYSDDFLRGSGYIITIADFKKECEETARLIALDPICYNKRIKRVHKAYIAFEKYYLSGQLHNATARAEMVQHFTQVVENAYRTRNMPKELIIQIYELANNETAHLIKSWLGGKLALEQRNEISGQLTAHLLLDWQEGRLPIAINKLLDAEKSINHTTSALLKCFREEKLPASIHESILEEVFKLLDIDVETAKLRSTSALGAAINNVRDFVLSSKQLPIYTELLSRWSHNKLPKQASTQLEQYITQVIEKMNLKEDPALTQQFAKLAVEKFVYKVAHENNYPEHIVKAVSELAVKLVREDISPALSLGQNMVRCGETVYNEVMKQLHELWISEKLPSAKSMFLQELVLHDLKQLHDDVTKYVWLNRHLVSITQKLDELARSMALQSMAKLEPPKADFLQGNEKQKKIHDGQGFFPPPPPMP